MVETRPLSKKPVKAKLIRRMAEELKKRTDVEIESDNENVTKTEVGNLEKDDLQCVTDESYASRAARTGGAKKRSAVTTALNDNKLPGRSWTEISLRIKIRAQNRCFMFLMKRIFRIKTYCVYTGDRAGRYK